MALRKRGRDRSVTPASFRLETSSMEAASKPERTPSIRPRAFSTAGRWPATLAERSARIRDSSASNHGGRSSIPRGAVASSAFLRPFRNLNMDGTGTGSVAPRDLPEALDPVDLPDDLHDGAGNQVLPWLAREDPGADGGARVGLPLVHVRAVDGAPRLGKEPHDEGIVGKDAVEGWGHGTDMGDPEGVPLDVLDGDDVQGPVEGGEGAGDHEDPFPRGEGILELVGELRAPHADDDLVHLTRHPLEHRLVAVVVRLEPSDVEPPGHSPATMAAIRAAKAPAVKPASMFTTARTEQDWSMEARAALPSPMYPYPEETGRPTTGRSTSPATTAGRVPSRPAATMKTWASRTDLRAGKSRWIPAAPTSYAVRTSQPISSAMSFASSAAGRSAVPAVRMATIPPVFSWTGNRKATMARGTSRCSAWNPSSPQRLRISSAWSGVTLVTMHRPWAATARTVISASWADAFPSARMTLGTPHRAALPRSRRAYSPSCSIRSPSIREAASSRVSSPRR